MTRQTGPVPCFFPSSPLPAAAGCPALFCETLVNCQSSTVSSESASFGADPTYFPCNAPFPHATMPPVAYPSCNTVLQSPTPAVLLCYHWPYGGPQFLHPPCHAAAAGAETLRPSHPLRVPAASAALHDVGWLLQGVAWVIGSAPRSAGAAHFLAAILRSSADISSRFALPRLWDPSCSNNGRGGAATG